MSARRRTFRWRMAQGLASALLDGAWNRSAMLERARDALGRRPAWLTEIVQAAHQAFSRPPHDARDALAAFLLEREALTVALRSGEAKAIHVRHWRADEPRMAPGRWPVPPLATLTDLAHALGLDEGQLSWLADRRGWEHRTQVAALQNYRYRWWGKPGGGARLLEAPKRRLKEVQRFIWKEILEPIAPHPAAHGFRAGRSVLTHANLHVGNEAVVRFDLRAFFAHVPVGRALTVFRKAGYPEEVARSLIGLCTNRVPLGVLALAPAGRTPGEIAAAFQLRARLRGRHLPQGAPTSPALANLCAHGMDVRLAALAARLGLSYSRYADDLTFSGDRGLLGMSARLEAWVARIVRDEGFSLHPEKSRTMARWEQQRVTGVVVNEKPNLPRRQFDRLKARFHRCVMQGPPAEATEAAALQSELLGHLAWVEYLNPARGEKLRRLFQRVAWPASHAE